MSATIACVDVGQGDCTVAMDLGSRDALLIDCPEGKHQLAIEELRQLGFGRLEVAIVSHTHGDHFGGVLDVLEELGDRFTGTLYYNHDSLMATPVAGEARRVAGRKLRALIHRAREFGERVLRAETTTPPGMVGTIRWELLAPTYGEIQAAIVDGDANLASGVVLLQVGSQAVLVGGDAQLTTWERIAHQIPTGAVVRWPHHGGSLGASADSDRRVLEIIQPAVVLVSVGTGNPHGHPTGAFFAAVGGRPGRLLCTQATSACVAGPGRGGICAGTIRIHAPGMGEPTVVPHAADHSAVIAAFGNGQCTERSL